MKQKGKQLTVLIMLFVCAIILMDFRPVLSNAEELIDITEDEKLEITGLEDVVYNGKNQEQNIQVKYNGETLREDTDYYCLYSNHKNAGTAMIRIVGKGNYTGTASEEYTITARPLNVTAESKTKVYGEDDPELTYTYSNNVNVGTATVKIIGRGIYRDVKKVTFKIVPKTPSSLKAKLPL